MSEPPLCPSCTQPAIRLADGWHCRNEACPEYGQALQDGEPPPDEPAAPGPPDRLPGAGA